MTGWGIAMAVVPDAQRDAMAATLAGLNRQSFAFPPDHGGRVVSTILGDPMLRAVWLEELDGMRARVQENRRALANALREATGSDRMGAVAAQQGMFSILPLTEAQVTKAARGSRNLHAMGRAGEHGRHGPVARGRRGARGGRGIARVAQPLGFANVPQRNV